MLCACGGEPASAKLTVNADTVSSTGLEYTLELAGDGKLEFSPDGYYLEHNVGGAWTKVEEKTLTASSEKTTWEEAKSESFTLDWTSRFGELEGGLYKLHLYVTLDGEDKNLSADFQVIVQEQE